MKLALIGYGEMGKLIEGIAKVRGHEIIAVIQGSDAELSAADLAERLRGADAAIDFTVADAVMKNVDACLLAGVPLVEGTTGWNTQLEDVKASVEKHDGAFVFGANFSIGVNIFYRLADIAAELLAKFSEYEAFIEEQHHSRKKDAPSGTALKLKDIVSKHVRVGDVAATRAGNIPGTHRLGFDGPADQILLEHMARSRDGFAAGSLMAAEWIADKKGFYEFTDVIGQKIG